MIGEIFQELEARLPLPLLCPTQIWKPELSLRIVKASDGELFENEATLDQQREMRLACRAGILLMNDDLENSHHISQPIESPTGSFWHAIAHRREGDFSNANYWWRRVGEHPVFPQVFKAATSVLKSDDEVSEQLLKKLVRGGIWLPAELTDACEQAGQNADASLRAIQSAEMRILFDWCHQQI